MRQAEARFRGAHVGGRKGARNRQQTYIRIRCKVYVAEARLKHNSVCRESMGGDAQEAADVQQDPQPRCAHLGK